MVTGFTDVEDPETAEEAGPTLTEQVEQEEENLRERQRNSALYLALSEGYLRNPDAKLQVRSFVHTVFIRFSEL